MTITRRHFLRTASATALSVAAMPSFSTALGAQKVRLKKAVKFGMIHGGSILERFELAKKCGFLGVEADSPSNLNREEMVRARDKTGVVIHGVIDSVHWGKPLSDPKPEVRAEGLAALKTALEDAKHYGADTCLLVPGVVRRDKDGKSLVSFDEWGAIDGGGEESYPAGRATRRQNRH